MEKDTTNKGLWIARDEDGILAVYWGEPKLDKTYGEKGTFYGHQWIRLSSYMYPELTYENSPKPLIVPND